MLCRPLMLTASHQLKWVESRLPEVGPHEVMVKTLAGAVSVGTELPMFRGNQRSSEPVGYPVMTGYESYAEVLACGREVEHMNAGDRVIAFYGHRTCAVLAAERVIPVPGTISAPLALLVILACDVAKGLNKLKIRPDEAVLITGAGAIGLLTVFNLAERNVAQIDVVEPVPQRRALARQLGATRVVSPTQDGGPALHDAYPVGIECSSRDSAFALLQERLAHNGRLCVLADGNLEPLTLQPAFHEKELHVVGSSDGEDYLAYAAWFWPRAARMATQLERLCEATTSATRLAEVLAEIASSDLPPIKVLVEYDW